MADGRSILERLPLGRTDLRVSPLGIGTGPWGDRLRWGYGQSYTETDLQAVFAVAVKAGINFFDSAEVYGRGHSERLLGQFIRTTGQTVVVATKFMPFPWRLRRKSLLQALQHSLDRLGRERVDLYQIHVPLPPVSIKTWMDAMAEAVDAGLIRAVGVSNCGLARIERAHRALAQRGVVLASNQVQYNLLHRAPEYNGLLRACREQGITLIAHSPLARGVLTAKYGPDNPPPGFRGYRFDRKYLTHMQPLITLLQEIGQAHGNKTPVQVALNWIIYKGAVPIPGAKNARQAEQNVGALGWRLTDDEIAALDNASEKTDQRSANEIKPRLRRNS